MVSEIDRLQVLCKVQVKVLAKEWADEMGISRLEIEIYADEYRDLMCQFSHKFKRFKIDKEPPCIRCDDTTVMYCGETEMVCNSFKKYIKE